MPQILILGAGKSSAHLIKHLAENTVIFNYDLLIIDINISLIPRWIDDLDRVKVLQIEPSDTSIYSQYIEQSQIVVSMLPAMMHLDIAKLCLKLGSHLITPSYISDEMRSLHNQVVTKDLIFLNEMGFDPGIDHMTTMKICSEIEAQQGKLIGYKSYAGGLVAPRSDDNPWHYKFSWNPRNVILAGQGGEIQYKESGEVEHLTYQNLFAQDEIVTVNQELEFDAYANRDSLKYESLYGWENIQTLYRGTLRVKGFCKAWNLLIDLGLTDNSNQIALSNQATYADFYTHFLKGKRSQDFLNEIQDQDLLEKLISIGFDDHQSLLAKINGSPAEILQSILEIKWKLQPEDTDWVVMVHFFEVELKGVKSIWESSLSLEGDDALYTAMSKTVGMPIAFAALMILQDKIKSRGVMMPSEEEIYEPILNDLESIGIVFKENRGELV